jgi:hypothetical protein
MGLEHGVQVGHAAGIVVQHGFAYGAHQDGQPILGVGVHGERCAAGWGCQRQGVGFGAVEWGHARLQKAVGKAAVRHQEKAALR